MEPTMTARIRRKDGLLAAAIDDELVLMSPEQSEYYGLDPVGRVIWDHLAQPVEVAGLCRRMAEHYAGDAAVIAADVMTFLRALADKGLIVSDD